jgi:hypothetical protein
MSYYGDIFAPRNLGLVSALPDQKQAFQMNSAVDNVLQQLQLGEDLIADGIEVLVRHWQTSTTAIGKLCAGTDRWQAALREIQTQANLAEIFRGRTII